MSLSRVKRLCADGMLCAAALILSYVEALFPVTAVIPVPGFKLGLANVAVMLAFFRLGAIDGVMISIVRVVIVGMLFGSAASVIYSIAGACAAQCVAASVVLGSGAVFGYLPVLLIASIVTGTLTGMTAALCSRIFYKVELLR